jgi:hypothetical protein
MSKKERCSNRATTAIEMEIAKDEIYGSLSRVYKGL